MQDVFVSRSELDKCGQSPVLFDALIGEDDTACVFRKTGTSSSASACGSLRVRMISTRMYAVSPTNTGAGKRASADGSEVDTFRSEQDAMFFPGG